MLRVCGNHFCYCATSLQAKLQKKPSDLHTHVRTNAQNVGFVFVCLFVFVLKRIVNYIYRNNQCYVY